MRRFPGLLAMALMLASCAERGPDNEFETWVITESLRIGTMEEGPASFGWIRSVDADGQGRVWVFDHQSQQIRVFGPDGAHLMNVGRKGAGPGEFHLAEGIAFGKDGRLWAPRCRELATLRLLRRRHVRGFASDDLLLVAGTLGSGDDPGRADPRLRLLGG